MEDHVTMKCEDLLEAVVTVHLMLRRVGTHHLFTGASTPATAPLEPSLTGP